jgi:subfamily B ATP-binding cassette protein HlyB/CyaB
LDSGLSCLLMLARFFGVPANAEPLSHQFTEPGKAFGETELLLAAKHLGFKAGAVESDWQRLPHIALPAIAQQKDGRYVIIARADAEKVLLQDPAEPKPLLLPRAIFEEAWSGRLILLTKRANLRPEDRKFDFTWFIPAIVKHRKLLGEVLLASFFLQLFALLTPLFFQVVIDKVLVHKGLTTLHVLAIGMLALTLFEVMLGGLRT